MLLALLVAAPASAQMPGGAPQSPPGALHRYYSAQNNTHWVTPTPVAGDYAYEQTLGFLHTTGGNGRTAIFGCRSGPADYFLSVDPACEGTTALGTYGWMDPARVDDLSVAVYRCLRPGVGHFASLDAGCEGQTSEGRLGYTRARQPALARYNNGSTHWVTTGVVGAGFQLEGVLGFLLADAAPDRRALYECAAGADRFLSPDVGCEGRTELGRSGYLFTTAQPDSVPVYRCATASDHFASVDPGCEDQRGEGLLGYARAAQEILQRAYNPATNTHWVTTGPIGRGWFHEFALGFVLQRSGDDRVALYGCLAGPADYFLSLDAACEGQSTQRQEGWVYSGAQGTPLYRCLRPGIGHFASSDAGCEGQTPEARLGFLRSDGPEPPPPPLRLTCAASDARVSASLGGKKVRRVRFGGSYVISGRVRNGDGTPVAGAIVSILIGDRKPIVLGTAQAGAKGGYRFRVRPGKNRILHAGFRPRANASDLACSRRVKLNVRAGVTLSARPKRVSIGGRVRFRGRLLGKPIPKVGKLIDLQAFDGGRWRTFQTVRANRKGSYRARYRFTRTRSARTFRFRARARREARYPYSLGVSKTVRVRVR